MSLLRPRTSPAFVMLYTWVLVLSWVYATATSGFGFQAPAKSTRCVLVEFYFDSSQAGHSQALGELEQLVATKVGIEVVSRDVHQQVKNQQRLEKLAAHFKFDSTRTPVLYICNRVIHPHESKDHWRTMLEEALELQVYTRVGCSRCTAAKKYLEQLLKRYPAFTIRYREISQDVRARNDLEQLVQRFRVAASSTPVFHFMDSLIVGFDSDSTSGPRLENALKKWTIDCKAHSKTSQSQVKPTSAERNKVSEVTVPLPF